jgi:hypothetical protein
MYTLSWSSVNSNRAGGTPQAYTIFKDRSVKEKEHYEN